MIEQILNKLGQNDLLDDISEYAVKDPVGSHLIFEMNSAIKQNKAPLFNLNGLFDQDLFTVIIICSLFETKKIN